MKLNSKIFFYYHWKINTQFYNPYIYIIEHIQSIFSSGLFYIYNKLSHLIEDNIAGISSHHCKDNFLSTNQWKKVITRAKANKFQPFSLHPKSDCFFSL